METVSIVNKIKKGNKVVGYKLSNGSSATREEVVCLIAEGKIDNYGARIAGNKLIVSENIRAKRNKKLREYIFTSISQGLDKSDLKYRLKDINSGQYRLVNLEQLMYLTALKEVKNCVNRVYKDGIHTILVSDDNQYDLTDSRTSDIRLRGGIEEYKKTLINTVNTINLYIEGINERLNKLDFGKPAVCLVGESKSSSKLEVKFCLRLGKEDLVELVIGCIEAYNNSYRLYLTDKTTGIRKNYANVSIAMQDISDCMEIWLINNKM